MSGRARAWLGVARAWLGVARAWPGVTRTWPEDFNFSLLPQPIETCKSLGRMWWHWERLVEPGISFSTVGVTYAWCFKRLSVRMTSLALLKRPILWSATLMMVTVSPSCCMSVCFLYSAKVAFATEPDHCQLRKVSKAATMMVHESISRFDASNSFPILSTISLKSLHISSLWMIALPSSSFASLSSPFATCVSMPW